MATWLSTGNAMVASAVAIAMLSMPWKTPQMAQGANAVHLHVDPRPELAWHPARTRRRVERQGLLSTFAFQFGY
jgi:hypothetical protein